MFALIKQGGLYVPRPINPPPLEGVNESCAVSNALCHLNEFGGLYLNVPKVPPPPLQRELMYPVACPVSNALLMIPVASRVHISKKLSR